MPGLAGIVLSLGRESVQAVLTRMSTALPCHQNCSPEIWTSEQTGLVAEGSGREPMLSIDNDGPGGSKIILGVVGQIFRDDILRERLGKIAGERNWPPGLAVDLRTIFKEYGAAGLQGLNGAYVIAVWEEQQARLTLVSDRGGIQPFYYSLHGQDLVFSSRQQAISDLPDFNRRINPAALFDLLSAEQMLDERTLFADIQALPPAAQVTFQHGHLQIESYWQPKLYATGDRVPGEAEAIEGLADRVLFAVKLFSESGAADSIGSGACLLLTGGLDSRLLAASLIRCQVDLPLTANTIGHERARDVRYGREIARATGLPYTVLPANPRYLANEAAEYVRRTEGGSNVHASWILGEVNYLKMDRISAIFTGVGAEAVSGRHWISEQPVTSRQEALERLCGTRWTFSRAASLLRPEIRADAMQASRESLRRTLEQAPSDDLLGWGDFFSYRQNRRHPTGNVLSEDVLVLEPFFENRLMDYAYSLPPELRNKGMLYKKMIVRRFPEVAGIGYTDSGTRLVDELNGRSATGSLTAKIQNYSRRANNRLARRFPAFRQEPFGDKPAQAIYYNHWLRTANRPFVLSLLERKDLYADYLNADQVHRMVADHMAGRIDEFRLVDAVITFALWRDQYDKMS